MEEFFCESHDVFEIFIPDEPGSKYGTVLNEQTNRKHVRRLTGNLVIDWGVRVERL